MTTISESENLDLIFLMDRSGSMGGFEKDTIGGFNSFIQREKAKELNTTVTTILFDSREYSKEQITNMIQNHSWEFLYIGADIDSYREAGNIGIRKSRVAKYRKSRRGVEDLYTSVENASYCLREDRNLDDETWKESLRKYD